MGGQCFQMTGKHGLVCTSITTDTWLNTLCYDLMMATRSQGNRKILAPHDLVGPLSYMWPVAKQNVVIGHMTVLQYCSQWNHTFFSAMFLSYVFSIAHISDQLLDASHSYPLKKPCVLCAPFKSLHKSHFILWIIVRFMSLPWWSSLFLQFSTFKLCLYFCSKWCYGENHFS